MMDPLLAAMIYNVLKIVIKHKTVCGTVKDHVIKWSVSGQNDETLGSQFFTFWMNIMG